MTYNKKKILNFLYNNYLFDADNNPIIISSTDITKAENVTLNKIKRSSFKITLDDKIIEGKSIYKWSAKGDKIKNGTML